MSRFFSTLATAILLCGIAGCGGSNFPDPTPVSGTVTYDGKPVEGAKVTFLAKGGDAPRNASGTTDAQGKFQLTTFRTNDGAIPGNYTVTIAKIESAAASESIDVTDDSGEFGADYGAMMDSAAAGKSMAEAGESKLPAKYADAAQSGLERTVAEGQPNEFDFDLQ